MDLKTAIKTLESLKGISNIHILKEEQKDIILNLEDENNLGVHKCLEKKYSIVITHDSSFRDPTCPIVKKENGHTILPEVPFPEINSISSSPSKEVHDYLAKEFNLKLKDEATLILGLN